MIQLENSNPYSKSEILSSIDDIQTKISYFYNSISPDLFFHEGLGGWSPAQNLSHITDIGNLANILLRLPRFLFSIFGKRPSQKDFKTLLTDYIGSDKVIYIGPLSPAQIPPKNGNSQIQELITKWENVCKLHKEIIIEIPEPDLDAYSLPHPSMGMLSLREVLYLLIIHPIHHSYKVEQKIRTKESI